MREHRGCPAELLGGREYIGANSFSPFFGISARPLQEVYVDVFGPLPRSSRRDEFILNMVDYFIRCNWVVPLRKMMSSTDMSPLTRSLKHNPLFNRRPSLSPHLPSLPTFTL
ncbi:hypothetical protein J6590_024808 [Homalodisca vitripennis]|nr:hypothetical protein J6590_024808 [Homalodisca vitripennis]